jgi:hypothetical protein
VKYFQNSIIITIIGLITAFFIGGLEALYITALLAILEITLSFDNAVVNAKILEMMSKEWQTRFINYGIPIAVFGMRFLFPLLIVATISDMSLSDTFSLALNEPSQYSTLLKSKEELIFAFGGAFLLMVFLDFFFEEKEIIWIKKIENSSITKRLGSVNNIEISLATIIGLIISSQTLNNDIVFYYFSGVFLYILLQSLDSFLSTDTLKSGIAGFIYLEVLDASFSFDGVIGAFALSNNLFIITIGLGIGAFFVRSLTIYLVHKKTLQEFIYLEHGAHYAIGTLAFLMFIKIFYHISEVVVGSLGLGIILLAFIHSYYENKKIED